MAQEVLLKDGKVLLDGKEILKFEKINIIQYSFYALDSDDEILLHKSFDNGTSKYADDDYYTLNFLTLKTKVRTIDYSKIMAFMNSNKSMQKLIAWLLKEKVLDASGKLNPEKVEIFYEKYNEPE